MKTPTAQPAHRLWRRPQGLRRRTELPALAALAQPAFTSAAAHDFLVPNPRPDLTFDPNTLRMLESP